LGIAGVIDASSSGLCGALCLMALVKVAEGAVEGGEGLQICGEISLVHQSFSQSVAMPTDGGEG